MVGRNNAAPPGNGNCKRRIGIMTAIGRRLAIGALATLAMMPMAARAAAPEVETLTLLHINDVYEIAPVKGQGGFAQLMTLLRRERAAHPHTITTVGGDFLSPSIMSGITRGAQMIALFKAIQVDAVAFGNHEFDFGPDLAAERIRQSNFPWIGTNVLNRDGSEFTGATATWMKTEGHLKVGFLGLLTPETMAISRTGTVKVTDPIPAARAAVATLRKEGADVIVALTHEDFADDQALASKVKGIDVILGGHDHEPMSLYADGVLIFKVGHDAHYLGAVDLRVTITDTPRGRKVQVLPTGMRMESTAGVAPDPTVGAVVGKYERKLGADLAQVIGRTGVALDSHEDVVRTREAAFGDLIADALRARLKADVAITNGGGIRGDTTYPAGTSLTRRIILTELPFGNDAVMYALSGAQLRAALENGFSQIEAKAGRFPQISGMVVHYDPKAPAGHRVVAVTVGGKPLDPAATYKVATNDYMASGGDGYTMFAAGKPLVDDRGGLLLASVVMDAIRQAGTVAPKIEGRIIPVP